MAKQGKKLKTIIKLQIEGGKATPAPPVGPALGQHGVSIMDFCKAYNDATKDKMGDVVPVEISVFQDNSFTFITKTSPVSTLIKKLGKISKGSSMPGRDRSRSINRSVIKEIAKIKMEDLNAFNEEAAEKIVEGSARSMGIEVVG